MRVDEPGIVPYDLPEIDRAARAIGGGRPRKPELDLREATVVGVSATFTTADIKFSGDANAQPGIGCLAGYVPDVGDTVWVLQNGSDRVVIGSLRPGSQTPGQIVGAAIREDDSGTFVGTQVTVAGQTAAFVALAGWAYEWVYEGNFQSTVAGDRILLRGQLDGTGANLVAAYFSTPTGGSIDCSWTRLIRASKLTPGAHTLGLTAQRASGTGSCSFDGSTANPRGVYIKALGPDV